MSFSDLRGLFPDGDRHWDSIFGTLAEEGRAEISRISQLRRLEKGEIIASEGAESTAIGYVLEGALGMVKTLPDGRVHIIGILMPTDIYGRLFDGPNSYEIEALSPTTVLCFDRAPFEAMLRKAPEIERRFLVSVLDELDAAREWILLLNGTKVIQRVASFLVFLLRRRRELMGSEDGPTLSVRLPIRRPDLARCLGIRPESLSRAIHRLGNDGVIRIADAETFDILDLPALIEVSGQDLVMED